MSSDSDNPPNDHSPSADKPPVNPFADDMAGRATDDNPYASPDFDPTKAPPDAYEMTQSHRGGLMLCLGLTGLVLALVSVPGGFCCSFLCLPLPFASLGASLPAWIMGQKDIRAMNAGVMDPSGRSMTLAGMILGIVATILVALLVLLYVGLAVFVGIGVMFDPVFSS